MIDSYHGVYEDQSVPGCWVVARMRRPDYGQEATTCDLSVAYTGTSGWQPARPQSWGRQSTERPQWLHGIVGDTPISAAAGVE